MIALILHLQIDEEKPLDYEDDLSDEKKDEVDEERNDNLNQIAIVIIYTMLFSLQIKIIKI